MIFVLPSVLANTTRASYQRQRSYRRVVGQNTNSYAKTKAKVKLSAAPSCTFTLSLTRISRVLVLVLSQTIPLKIAKGLENINVSAS